MNATCADFKPTLALVDVLKACGLTPAGFKLQTRTVAGEWPQEQQPLKPNRTEPNLCLPFYCSPRFPRCERRTAAVAFSPSEAGKKR